MTQAIATLCAGASRGLVTAIADRLRDELAVHTAGRFGAVGAMKEAFLAGDPCDLMILTDAMIRGMVAEGQLSAIGVTPLGLVESLQSRLREFPNGATAMRAMAESGEAGAIGCTQISEILFTSGVALVAPLPSQFELGTVYTAAVSARATQPALAQQVIALLASESSAELRRRCGFE
jgi:molybdate transport system substrate-binding protein